MIGPFSRAGRDTPISHARICRAGYGHPEFRTETEGGLAPGGRVCYTDRDKAENGHTAKNGRHPGEAEHHREAQKRGEEWTQTSKT